MNKIGVTGGAGFIGSYVVDELRHRGYKPLIMDRHDHGPREDIAETFLGDVTDESSMRELGAHVDGIIHLAAVLGTQETVRYPTPAVRSNMLGGLNFLEAISQYDIPGAYIAVGNWWMNNPYSISKNMVERFCHMYNADRGARVNSVRGMNAYGPRQSVAPPFGPAKVRKITPSFVCRALTGQPIEVYGDGSQISDMIYVKDVAVALVNALEYADRGEVADRAIEVGPARSSTVNDTAKAIIEATVSIGYDPVEIHHLPMRPGEKAGSVVAADVETLPLIGMHHSQLVPFDQGIRETIDWFIRTKGTRWYE